jgi:signal transduction histidine kinase
MLFIGGFVIFIIQYRRRKMVYEQEKTLLNEQHVQEILNTRLEIQYQTMQDIGREIHDNIGQKLTLASIYANKMTYENKYPGQQEQIAAIGSILTESIDELRKLSRSLTNAHTDMDELKTLIETECNRINDLNICHIHFSCAQTGYNISTTLKNFILRIVQEFFQNSLKHARCKNIYLGFSRDERGLRIEISDDGAGFDMNGHAARESKGIGLQNMKKRAELIGAEFDFSSTPNKGTSLSLFIPDNKLNDIT